jgi:hypothetical protein
LIATLVLAGSLQGQQPRPAFPDSGVHVRYKRHDEKARRSARVLGLEGRLLRVRLDSTGEYAHEALDSIQGLQLGTRRTPGEGAERGALIGLLTGASIALVASILVRASEADENCNDCWVSASGAMAVLGVLGTGVFTVAGALIGAAAPGETWESVPTSARRQMERGPQLRLTLRLTVPSVGQRPSYR